MSERTGELSSRSVLLVLSVLAVLVVLNVPELGADTRMFRPETIEPSGPLAWLVRLADSEWDLGIPRAMALAAGVLVAVAGIVTLVVRTWKYWAPGCARRGRRLPPARALGAATARLAPVERRRGSSRTTPPTRSSWRESSCSTATIRTGTTTATRASSVSTASTARPPRRRERSRWPYAIWPTSPARRCRPPRGACSRLLSTTIACSSCSPRWAWVPRRSHSARRPAVGLAAGAALAANPLAVHGVWFGVADAPSLVFLLLAFALASRSRGGRSGRLPRHRHPPQAVRPRRATVPRRAAPRRGDAPRGPLSCGRRIRRSAPRRLPALPGRRCRRPVAGHDRLRRRHVPHHRLRAVRASSSRSG